MRYLIVYLLASGLFCLSWAVVLRARTKRDP